VTAGAEGHAVVVSWTPAPVPSDKTPLGYLVIAEPGEAVQVVDVAENAAVFEALGPGPYAFRVLVYYADGVGARSTASNVVEVGPVEP